MARAILSAGAYAPLLRFERRAARAELAWSSLGGPSRGRRAVAGWDEDALTMAVEAARAALAGGAVRVSRVAFASTSAPFLDRLNSGLLIDALNLSPAIDALDVAGSRRCAVSALSRALRGEGEGVELIAAGEKRRAQPGSASHLAWGDGAGAALVGEGPGVARLLASASLNIDLLDTYTSADRGLPYPAEERFARDVAVEKVLAPIVKQVLAAAGVEGSAIAGAVVAEPVAGAYKALQRPCGLVAPNFCDEIARELGDMGAATPLFGLALALERMNRGEKLLLVGFGNGADALLLEISGEASTGAGAMLGSGVPFSSYSRLLNLTGGIDLDWGPRAEVNQKTSASVLARHGRDMHGFVGGRDARGNVQFPKTPIPVSPEAKGPEAYTDVVLRDVPAKVFSVTADRLNFTPDPPFYFGLVQFENGARVAMEMCDSESGAPDVGAPMRMRFRIKTIDRQRQFRSYFWKAAPIARPALPKEKA